MHQRPEMRGQQAQIRAQRAHAIGLRRCREQHPVRTLPVLHQRFRDDLEPQPAKHDSGEELPVLATDADVLCESPDALEHVAFDERVCVTEYIAQKAGRERAAKKGPDLRTRRTGHWYRALKHVEKARQDIRTTMFRCRDERPHLRRRCEVVVVHEQDIVATCDCYGRVSGGAEIAIWLADDAPVADSEFRLESIEKADRVLLFAAVIDEHDLEARIVLLPDRIERSIEKSRTIAMCDAHAD